MTRPQGSPRRQNKTIDVIALLRLGHLYTAKQISEHCKVCPHFVMATLRALEERGMVRFVGWAERQEDTRGTLPATWRWV